MPPQFFAQDDSTSIAVLPSTLGGLKVHCRNFLGHFFDKNHQIFGFSRFFRSRVPWCSAMFHRVPRHDLVFLAISRTLSFQNIQKHHSTEIKNFIFRILKKYFFRNFRNFEIFEKIIDFQKNQDLQILKAHESG